MIKMKTLLLRCPKCGNTMKYQPRTMILSSKSKRCVYCGKSFMVRQCIIRESDSIA